MRRKAFNLICILVLIGLGFQIFMKIKTNRVIPPNDLKIAGTIEIEDGDMLERDIIPQLCLTFELKEQEVKEILSLPRSSFLINEDLTDFRRLEGIFLPGQYQISASDTLEEWSKHMVELAESRYTTLSANETKLNTLKPKEHIVIASIVEAECLANKQYPETAAVFLNRLANQNALQSCVTVEYALGFQRAFLNEEDIRIASSYNTYVVSGLPAGPICCVDDASLRAAIRPSEDPSLYYFFYDYLQNEIFFYADYALFEQEAMASRNRFILEPPVGLQDKIDKQTLFGVR